MTGFLILFGLSFVLLPCKGKITSPADGTRLTFLPGSTANIIWSFDDDISQVDFRGWFFFSDGLDGHPLAAIVDDEEPKIHVYREKSGLSGVTIVKPATLVLKNVNQTYNGTYRFDIIGPHVFDRSGVDVFIAEKPTVTVSCSSPITVNEGDDVTCVCRGNGGNPPADVTWYKDDVQVGEKGKGNQTLGLSNIDKTGSGTYKCVAQSHTLTDEKSVQIIVYYAVPPTVVSLTSTPENAVFGESVVITCEAIAVPLPSYTIIHNDTEVVSTHKTYIITVLKYSHAGSYKCIATNILGNSSKIFSLSVAVTRTTNAPTTKNFGTEKAALEECNCSGTQWYIVVVSLVSGAIIGLFFAYILLCSHRRWFRNRKTGRNPEAQTTEVDTTYQDLDLSKMKTEDNYQPLRNRNPERDPEAQTKEVDTTYQELDLTKMNTEGDNYQSLRNRNHERDHEPQTTEVDTTYQDLDHTRMNTEDNYQSLRSRKPQSNSEPQTTEVDATYKELDLTKMNAKDDYQSLRVNAASNDAANVDDFSYTDVKGPEPEVII